MMLAPTERDQRHEPDVCYEVELNDAQGHLRADPESLERLIRDVLRIEAVKRASISLVLVDNASIREVNRRELGHDWATDVITFPLSAPEDEVLGGELMVSGEMAQAVAVEHGHDAWTELALYIVHGLLHLRGYDDLGEADAREMRRREGEVLALLGLTNPFTLVEHGRASVTESE